MCPTTSSSSRCDPTLPSPQPPTGVEPQGRVVEEGGVEVGGLGVDVPARVGLEGTRDRAEVVTGDIDSRDFTRLPNFQNLLVSLTPYNRRSLLRVGQGTYFSEPLRVVRRRKGDIPLLLLPYSFPLVTVLSVTHPYYRPLPVTSLRNGSLYPRSDRRGPSPARPPPLRIFHPPVLFPSHVSPQRD